MDYVTLKVASSSNPKLVAGSISHALKGDGKDAWKPVEILAIGASSVNQAVKAIAISAGHLGTYGQSLYTRIGFKTAEIDGEERTIMRFIVEAK